MITVRYRSVGFEEFKSDPKITAIKLSYRNVEPRIPQDRARLKELEFSLFIVDYSEKPQRRGI